MKEIHVACKNSYTFWKDNQPDAFISRLTTMGMQEKWGVSPGTLHLGFSVINVAVLAVLIKFLKSFCHQKAMFNS